MIKRRATIREYHISFLNAIGETIGTKDLSETVNYCLAQYRQSLSVSNSVLSTPSKLEVKPIEDNFAESISGLL